MSALDVSHRGAIYLLPPKLAALHDDPEWHYHLLLGTEAGTAHFVFGTSSEQDWTTHAERLTVEASPVGPAGTGLAKRTHCLGSVLVRAATPQALQSRKGALPADMRPNVDALVQAGVGYRTGPGYERPAGEVSFRGRVAEVLPASRARLGVRYVVILTPHVYSARRCYQFVVPLVEAEDMDDTGFPAVRAPWVRSLTNGATDAFYAVGRLGTAVWHGRHLEVDPTRYSVDRRELEPIEDNVLDALAVPAVGSLDVATSVPAGHPSNGPRPPAERVDH